MKIILSRKGFDSSNGGIPSIIFPDGSMLSFPIPSDDRETYKDFVYEGIEYAQILKDLRYKGALNCHADPDLDQGRRKDCISGWVPAFGQIGSSASYLNNIGVEEGDLFLFFGNYHFVENDHGTIRYTRNTGDFYRDHDIQVIWGYLQVGGILRTQEQQRALMWHPHSNENRVNDATNVIYKASETLSFDASKPGAGILAFDEKRVLTRYGCNKATWKMNNVYDVGNIYGNRKNQAKDPIKGIYYAGIWQELGLKESEECTAWARDVISDERREATKGNVLLTAERHNWGCHSIMDWRKTSYILRKDGTITFVVYEGEDITDMYGRISDNDLSFIQEHIDEYIDQQRDIDACDGVSWSIQYGWKEVEAGYVYGTGLERITEILFSAEQAVRGVDHDDRCGQTARGYASELLWRILCRGPGRSAGGIGGGGECIPGGTGGDGGQAGNRFETV